MLPMKNPSSVGDMSNTDFAISGTPVMNIKNAPTENVMHNVYPQ